MNGGKSVLAGAALLVLAACTDSKQAQRAAEFQDRPADVTCRSFGAVLFQGRSTGKVIYDEGGSVTFVDAANGRLTTIEGDCMIVYAAPGGDREPAAPASKAATPAR